MLTLEITDLYKAHRRLSRQSGGTVVGHILGFRLGDQRAEGSDHPGIEFSTGCISDIVHGFDGLDSRFVLLGCDQIR